MQMKSSKLMLAMAFSAGLAMGIVGTGSGIAQLAGIKMKPLLDTSASDQPGKHAIVVTGEFAPGISTGRHTHPGDEYAVVIDGALQLNPEGGPSRIINAGEAYHNPAGLIHETKNVGTVPTKVVSIFVITKERPVAEPVK